MPYRYSRSAFGPKLANLCEELDKTIGTRSSGNNFGVEVRYPGSMRLSRKATAVSLISIKEIRESCPDIDSVLTPQSGREIISSSKTMDQGLSLTLDSQHLNIHETDPEAAEFLVLDFDAESAAVLQDEHEHIKMSYDALAETGGLAHHDGWSFNEPSLVIGYLRAAKTPKMYGQRQDVSEIATEIVESHLPLRFKSNPAVSKFVDLI